MRLENTIVGIDLADKKQMVVCDHPSKVLARRTFRYRGLGSRVRVGLGGRPGGGEGFVWVTVSCEPTGLRPLRAPNKT